MSRSVPEWVGKTPDSAAPPRVRLRVFLHYSGRCQCGCGRNILPFERWELDHIVSLISGGENREGNLHPLLEEHHKNKTKADIAEKSKTYQVRLKHYGLRKTRGRPIPGSKRSGLKKKFSGEVVKRRG